MVVIIPIVIYCIFLFPFLNLIPGNDGNTEFVHSYLWFQGIDATSHVPFKMILFSIFFKFFGYHYTGYIGLLLGIAGIFALYSIAKTLFDKKIALISTIFLSTSGIYLSVGAFGIRDFLITVFILIAFAFYLKSRFRLYALFACLAIFTKEPAILFPFSIVISELLTKRKTTFTSLFPVIAFLFYVAYIHFSGHHLWNMWNFSPTSSKGIIYTIIYNVITLHIFNKYAYENWLHLFIFNFNWIFWIAAIISIYFIKTKEYKSNLLPIVLFFLFYSLLILTFQTWTITRYILPLLPFLYLFAAITITRVPYKNVFIVFFIIISLISLTHSVDPVSNTVWQKTKILGENFYLKPRLDGNDGITYNLQYLSVMQKRTNMIYSGNCSFPSRMNVSKKTRKILNLPPCR